MTLWNKLKEPSNLKTGICKFCNKPLNKNSFTYLFRSDVNLCNRCYNALHPKFEKFEINGVKGLALYEYSETFASLLFQFKGCYDYELAPLFLERAKFLLRIKYRKFILVPAPSTKESNEKRGFNHVKEAFKTLKRPIVDCVYKTRDVKQSSQGKNRKKIKEFLDIKDGEELRGQNVLLVDDVKTSGATLRAMVNLVKQYKPRRLNILVLSATEHGLDAKRNHRN